MRKLTQWLKDDEIDTIERVMASEEGRAHTPTPIWLIWLLQLSVIGLVSFFFWEIVKAR